MQELLNKAKALVVDNKAMVIKVGSTFIGALAGALIAGALVQSEEEAFEMHLPEEGLANDVVTE